MVHESETQFPATFVTLTYDQENLPYPGTLHPPHTRNFFKRLRKSTGPLSYYLCGEYGEKLHRPHYHAVVFGCSLADRDLHTTRNGCPVWTSPTLSAAWEFGHAEFTSFTYGAAQYVAGYVRKKLSLAKHPAHYERLNPFTGELITLEPEFARMSNRPAIGKKWFHKFKTDVYPRDFVVINGHQIKPPRYYDKLLENGYTLHGVAYPGNPALMMQVREKRYEDCIHRTRYELQAGEQIAEARAQLYSPRNL